MSSPQHRRTARPRAAALALLMLSALLFAACGSKDDERSAAASPASATPAAAAIYGEVLVRPSGDVEAGILTAARKVSRVEDPARELRRLLDEEVDGERGLYTREIEPWLGDTIGGFLLAEGSTDIENPDGGLLFSVRDRAAAERMIDSMRADGDTRRGGTIDGVAYDLDSEDDTPVALVGDFFFAGTLPALRAAIAASDGESLADTDRFTSVVDDLDADRLAWAWFDPRPLLPLLEDQDEVDPAVARVLAEAGDSAPATISVTARADEVVIEAAGDADVLPEPRGDGEVSIRDLPGDAWLALATPVLGQTISRAVRESGEYDTVAGQLRDATGLDLDRDLLGWLGGIAAFVRGTAPLDAGGGLVLGSSDPAASRRLVTRLQRIVGNMGIETAPTTGDGDGFQVKIPPIPQPLVVLAKDDRVAIALGTDSARDALDPTESFADSEPGKSAIASLGDGFEPSLVLVFDPLLNLLSSVGLDDDPDFRSALPYLGVYRSVAVGTKYDDGRVAARIVAALE